MNQSVLLEECESTNDVAKKMAENGASHGTWVSARKQVAGRGRLGRRWESIEGNLFLSIIVRPKTWSWIPMATAVAISECISDFNPRLKLEIKWPNDLLLDGAKAGGILCEAAGAGEKAFAVIGIGLNCAKAPQGLDQKTVALGISAEEIRMPLITSILDTLAELERAGADKLRQRFDLRAFLKPGTLIEWISSGVAHLGVVRGVGASGELLVDQDGVETKLYAEDVKVRRKDGS